MVRPLVALVLALSLPAHAALTAAVLYFENHTGDPKLDVMQKGLADMIITDLAAVPSVTVVDRARLQEILHEQSLQQTKFFDPATAVKTGRLMGATHVVTGSITSASPRLRLDIRLIDVKSGAVLATSQASGPETDLFELEQQLMQTFVETLRLKNTIPSSGRTTTDALLEYSKGLDQADQGDVKGARTTMAAVMQAAPGFTLAKTRYAELLQRVEAATERRTETLNVDEAWLRARVDEAFAVPLTRTRKQDLRYAIGYRCLAADLALRQLHESIGGDGHGVPNVVSASKRRGLDTLEDDVISAYDRLEADLLTLGPKAERGELPREAHDRARALWAESSFTLDCWSLSAARFDRARFVIDGENRRSHLEYRPTPAMRRPPLLDAELSRLKQEEASENDGYKSAELEAAGLTRAGRREEAVGALQRFLDAHPRDPNFDEAKKQIEEILEVGETKKALDLLQNCSSESMGTWQKLFHTITRVDGRPGVEKLVKQIDVCSKKQGQLMIGWKVNSYLFAAFSGLELGDCGLVNDQRAKAAKLGKVYEGSLQSVKGCDGR